MNVTSEQLRIRRPPSQACERTDCAGGVPLTQDELAPSLSLARGVPSTSSQHGVALSINRIVKIISRTLSISCVIPRLVIAVRTGRYTSAMPE